VYCDIHLGVAGLSVLKEPAPAQVAVTLSASLSEAKSLNRSGQAACVAGRLACATGAGRMTMVVFPRPGGIPKNAGSDYAVVKVRSKIV